MVVDESLTLRRYGAGGAREMRGVVQEIYEASYVDSIASGEHFDSVEAFMDRFESYASNPDLDLVIAYVDGEGVGQAWGWPLSSGSRWWTGLIGEPEPGFTAEDGQRTFALSEIMVKEAYQGKGVARKMHDSLLGGRSETRATLLAEADNIVAYRAYLGWGWRPTAELRPDWDGAPTFDVLVRDLP